MANGTRGAVGKTMANSNNAQASNGVVTTAEAQGATKVNTKKQKRRAKEAAKRKEQEQTQQPAEGVHPNDGQEVLDYDDDAYGDGDPYDEEQYYSEDDPAYHQHYDPAYPTGLQPGHPAMNGTRKKSSKKKKKSADPYAHTNHHHHYHSAAHVPPPPPPPPPPNAAMRAGHRTGRGDRIWNTSTQEERERIKEFWLSLKEEDRRSLVKVEKEAVLKKMKEQQKHSCSCTVCGRKRTAIEEELEVLYDAYYEELEQYAAKGAEWALLIPEPLFPSSRNQHHSRLPPDRMPPLIHSQPTRGHVEELPDDEEEEEDPDEDEYSDEDDDYDEDDYSDEEPEDLPRATADFFSFGNSLTVKGGILTVADDLLKNDGKKFIEMMEQLAERRMQREEEAQYAATTHPSSYNDYRHNHGGPEDEEFEDDEEEDYDSQEDFEDDDEDMDTMTEEQRMQEGRRMFQIFAARMFEQRVLSAYREKVASERQKKLLEELEEEEGIGAAREAKKAKDAEKRKQKKQQQKQKQAEEKAKKEAEKAEKEAAAKAEQEKKQEELRKRKEEQRVKKEEQRKAQEAELARKTAEKLKRQKEEQDRRQETERKAREQKEAERKAREEAKKKEREEREARERETREKKAKAEQERKEKAEQERVRKEAQVAQQASAVQQAAQAAKRAAAPAAVPIPLNLTRQPSNISSPYIQAVVPKAPTPVRPRQGSQQGSSKDHSPKTPAALAGQVKSGSPGGIGGAPQQNVPLAPKAILSRPPSLPPHSAIHQPNVMSPMGVAPPPGMPMPQGGAFGMPPGINGFHPGQPPMMPGMGQRAQMGPGMFSPSQQMGNPFPRQFGPPNGMPGPPPGMGAPAMPPFGRGIPDGPPGFGNQIPPFGAFADTMPARTVPGSQHSRQQSGSSGSVDPQPPIGASANQAIRPPAPIQRPSSVKPQDHMKGKTHDVDDLANHLGSSALLDDDESPESDYSDRRPSMPPGLAQTMSGGFSAPPPGYPNRPNPPRMDGYGNAGNTWGAPNSIGIPFGTPVIPGSSGWGGSPTNGWPSNNGFGLGLGGAPGISSRPRHQLIRIGIVDAYKAMIMTGKGTMDSFVEAKAIFNQLSSLRVVPPITEGDIRDLLDTEGTPQNGGGSFQLRKVGEGDMDVLIKWVADDGRHIVGGGDIGGQIGSPVVGPTHPGSSNSTPFGSLRGFPGLAGGGLSGLGQGL